MAPDVLNRLNPLKSIRTKQIKEVATERTIQLDLLKSVFGRISEDIRPPPKLSVQI